MKITQDNTLANSSKTTSKDHHQMKKLENGKNLSILKSKP